MADVPELLGGRYEVGELLGRGGMAEVHRGFDTRLGRPSRSRCCAPTWRATPRSSTGSAARRSRPPRSTTPAIVAVYDHGEDHVYTESGGADGQHPVHRHGVRRGAHPARAALRAEGSSSPTEAVRITEGVLDALAYSHRQGIVHRDIKPANVMLTADGAVKVMDFGIARAMADANATMTATQAVIGTAQYLSPEQAQGQPVDARSDLYSAGCMLFELLTGRPPFIGDSPVSIAYQHVGEAPGAAVALRRRHLRRPRRGRPPRPREAARRAATRTPPSSGPTCRRCGSAARSASPPAPRPPPSPAPPASRWPPAPEPPRPSRPRGLGPLRPHRRVRRPGRGPRRRRPATTTPLTRRERARGGAPGPGPGPLRSCSSSPCSPRSGCWSSGWSTTSAATTSPRSTVPRVVGAPEDAATATADPGRLPGRDGRRRRRHRARGQRRLAGPRGRHAGRQGHDRADHRSRAGRTTSRCPTSPGAPSTRRSSCSATSG